MKKWLLIGWFIGLLLIIFLIISQGIDEIQGVVQDVGGQIFWLAGFYLIPLLCAALSWFYLFPPRQKPPFLLVMQTTWIGLAINWLLPVAQVGGEIVRTRLLIKRGYPFRTTAASTLGDQTLQIATQALYALLGLGLFLFHWQDLQLILAIIGGVFYLSLLGFIFYRVQKAGLFKAIASLSKRILPLSRQENLAETANQVDLAVKQMYGRTPQLALAFAWRLGFRLVSAGEVWLTMNWLEHPVSLWEALILESLGQAVRSAAFLIPGGLGAQEGGLMLIGTALGVPSSISLSLSLCKRFRELILGIPGLIAWQIQARINQ
ncbi:MAG: flippase-like domain-containing protein [Cyanobacteria bacterium J06621_8]